MKLVYIKHEVNDWGLRTSIKLTTEVYGQALIIFLLFHYNNPKTPGRKECDGYQYVLYVETRSTFTSLKNKSSL